LKFSSNNLQNKNNDILNLENILNNNIKKSKIDNKKDIFIKKLTKLNLLKYIDRDKKFFKYNNNLNLNKLSVLFFFKKNKKYLDFFKSVLTNKKNINKTNINKTKIILS
jgi:hypothetical protein